MAKQTRRATRDRRVVIQKEDRRILRTLYDGRLYNARHLASLAGFPFGDRFRRRMQRLYEAGYVDRPHHQLYSLSLTNQYQGRNPTVYSLSARGEGYLVKEEQFRPTNQRWQRNNRDVGASHVAHELLIAQFRTVLTLGCPPEYPVQLVSWDQRQHLRSSFSTDSCGELVAEARSTTRHTVCPDAHFSLNKEKGGRIVQLHFMLECDRGSMKLSDMYKKYRAYLLYRRFGLQRDDYNGMSGFSVITITEKPDRAQSLRNLAAYVDHEYKQIPRQRKTFHVVAPNFTPAHAPMFKFACDDSFSLEKAHRIHGNIALSPGVENRLTTLW